MNSVPYYWINTRLCVQRYNNMLKEFSNQNITNHYRVEAYDCSDISNPSKYDYEQACVHSHLKAIETFLNSEYNIAIICEDDMTFELKKYWKKNISEVIINAPEDCGIIQLGVITQHIENFNKFDTEYIPYEKNPCSSAIAYLITRKYARELLEHLNIKYNGININKRKINNKYRLPVADELLYVNKITQESYKCYIYKYPMFIYPDNNDTQIGNCLPLHIASKRHLINYLKIT